MSETTTPASSNGKKKHMDLSNMPWWAPLLAGLGVGIAGGGYAGAQTNTITREEYQRDRAIQRETQRETNQKIDRLIEGVNQLTVKMAESNSLGKQMDLLQTTLKEHLADPEIHRVKISELEVRIKALESK